MNLIYFLYFLIIFVNSAYCPCPNNLSCLRPEECIKIDTKDSFTYPCSQNNSPQLYVCCVGNLLNKFNQSVQEPVQQNVTTEHRIEVPEEMFPTKCGQTSLSNRISGGSNASIGEYPWLVLLGYIQNGNEKEDTIQFACGGTIINKHYILTAAHCINIAGVTLKLVRLGELDLRNETDCDSKQKECADPVIDIEVDPKHLIVHELFDKQLNNDIALIRLKQQINFTDYIQPVCLPFNVNVTPTSLYNELFIIAGWGKINSESVSGSPILQFGYVESWDNFKCNKVVPPNIRPISQTQLCAIGRKGENACKGDSGSGLLRETPIDKSVRIVQYGIVSMASVLPCTLREYPTIYTRVDKYLDWIQSKVEY